MRAEYGECDRVQGALQTIPRVLALDDVTLDIEEGKLFALLGPNGAGKTTLLRILTTQINATSGSAKVLGLDIFAILLFDIISSR